MTQPHYEVRFEKDGDSFIVVLTTVGSGAIAAPQNIVSDARFTQEEKERLEALPKLERMRAIYHRLQESSVGQESYWPRVCVVMLGDLMRTAP